MATDTGAVRLGRTLRQLRESKDLSVDRVATHVGLEPAELAIIESGGTLPTAAMLQRLASAYEVAPIDIVCGLPESQPKYVEDPQPRGGITYGIGSNEQEAEAAHRQAKADRVPYYEYELPEDITEVEFLAAIARPMWLVEEYAITVNGILRAAPDRLAGEGFRVAAQIMAGKILDEAMSLRSIAEDKPNDMAGFLLNEMRKGKLKPGFKLVFGKKEPAESE